MWYSSCMIYKNFSVREVMDRTKSNLKFIENNKGDYDVFEVTQLVNSLLGLLVYPKEEQYNRIPQDSMQKAMEDDWPRSACKAKEGAADHLRDLVRRMRNAVVHFGIELKGEEEEIAHVRMFDECKCGKVVWEIELCVGEMKAVLEKLDSYIE